jgi:hypothetical protein
MTEKNKSPRKPKFKLGQVVSVKSYSGRKWRHGFQFGRIVKILPPMPKYPKQPFSYFLDDWISAQVEANLRPLTKKELAHD